jgi:uncharacterized protein YecA (UPF0149 family)
MHPSEHDIFDDITPLLSLAGRQLAQGLSADEFLHWMASYGHISAPSINALIDSQDEENSAFFRLLGVEIYNNTPLAANNYQPQPLPKPGRNEPCLCGSGHKYKQCCQQLPPPPPLERYNMLRHVLDAYPQNAMGKLVDSQVDTEAVADTAMQWLYEGEERRTLALLEPWFKGDAPLTRRHAPLFDPLMDVYLALGKPRKRQQLLERACRAKPPEVRLEAWQRKATILMDNGDKDGAWEAFTQAQRADPDAPSVAVLEITLLCANHQIEQAKQRAQFWRIRLERKGTASPELLELLEHCTVAPDEVLYGAAADNSPPLLGDDEAFSEHMIALAEAIRNAPPAKALYQLGDYGDTAELQPPAALRRIELQWQTLTEQWHEAPPWDCIDQWLPLLKEPLPWHSADIMLDLLNLLASEDLQPLQALFYEPLMQHCQALVKQILAQLQPGTKLPWGLLENRSFLSLLQQVAQECWQLDELELFCQHAEQLLALNPDDNHGIRENLSIAYLDLGQPEKTLQLCQTFADDALCTLPLNAVLALYIMGQTEQATAALDAAKQRHPKALDMLVATRPKPPEPSSYGIVVGGDEEAWLYREDTYHLWQSSGALQWLKAALKSHKKR